MAKSVLPFDELNSFKERLQKRFPSGKLVNGDGNLVIEDEDDIIDELLDLLLLAYALGNDVINEELSSDWTPQLDDVMGTVNEKVAGKTWEERVKEHFREGGTAEDIIRVAETETHRVANTSALRTAEHGGATKKTWVTMLDDRVRETHDYLEGQSVGIKEDFYTFDGDHASAPGLFSLPENNINCRCELIFS